MNIKKVFPTVFFIKENNKLKQKIDIIFENKNNTSDCILNIKSKNIDLKFPLKLSKGETKHEIFIPDIRDAIHIAFNLFLNDTLKHSLEIKWRPQRYWHVYLVQHAHFDPGYTNLPTDVMREYVGYLDNIIKYCDETSTWDDNSQFRYVIEQSWIIQHYLEHCSPQNAKKIIQLMKKNRIELNAFLGNNITEIMGAEQITRSLYGAFELKRKYGIPIRTAEHNDIPGLSWGAIMCLASAGIKYFIPGVPDYFRWVEKNRTFWDESKIMPNNVPCPFYWEDPAGNRILTYIHRQGAGGEIDYTLSYMEKFLNDLEKKNYKYEAVRYLLNGAGRDNAPPEVRFAYTAKEWNNKWAYPKLIVSTNIKFFEHLQRELKDDIPVFRGELPGTDYPTGALSTAKETAINRQSHEQIPTAEKLATIASITSGYTYPDEIIKDAYKNSIYYDEHLWGIAYPTGIAQDASASENNAYAYRAAALAHDVQMKSLNKIADEISIKSNRYHIIVFNPLSYNRTDIVHAPISQLRGCSLPLHEFHPRGRKDLSLSICGWCIDRDIINIPLNLVKKPFKIVDVQTGRAVPYQIRRIKTPYDTTPYASHKYLRGHFMEEELIEIIFTADDMPALGYKTFDIVPLEKNIKYENDIRVTDNSIENRYYKLKLNPRTGFIESIYDKELQKEIVDTNGKHKVNQIIARSIVTGKEESPVYAEISKGETGPVYGSLVVKTMIKGCPQITEEIILYSNIKRIDFANRILKDSDSTNEIYIAFPFNISKPQFRYEGCLSVIEPLKDQLPGTTSDSASVQHWVDIFDDKFGVAWSSIDAHLVCLGGLWPGYVSQAHHGLKPQGFKHEFLSDPSQLKDAYIYSYIINNNFKTNFQPVQVSDTLFRYSITTHKGDWKNGSARGFGWNVQNPLISTYFKGRQTGSLPSVKNFCEIDKENIILLTIKHAEDKNGVIVRLLETEGIETDVKIKLPFIKITKVYETNLAEENIKALLLKNDVMELRIKPWSINTFRIIK